MLTYSSETFDAVAIALMLQLVQSVEHDVIVACQQEYDDMRHPTMPGIQAAKTNSMRSPPCPAVLTISGARTVVL